MKILAPLTLASLLLITACTSTPPDKVDAQTSAAAAPLTITVHHYRCESGATIATSYPSSDSATVQYKDNVHDMQIAISGSGSRYVGGGLEWWTKGSGVGSEGTLFRHRADGTSGKAIEVCTGISKDGDPASAAVQFDPGQYEKASYQVKVTDDIEYGRGTIEAGDMPLLLDLYEPVDDQNSSRPGLLIIHGGGFVAGSRKMEQLVMFANEFASRGYLVASMSYRLSGDGPVLNSSTQHLLDAAQLEMSEAMREAYRQAGLNLKAPWAAFEDALLALQWLRDSTTLGIEPSRIAVLGSSAGAFTALNLAYRLNELAPQVAPPAAVTAIWGMLENDDTSVLETGEPPLLLIHGTDDKVVNFNSSLAMYRGAQDAGIPVELVPLQGRGHGLGRETNDFFNMRVDSGVTVFDKIAAFTNAALFEPENLPLVSCDAFGDACP